MASTITLITVATVTVWSAVGLVAALFIGRAISDPDHHEIELPGDETWLDDQPTEVLADAALQQRFNKVLVDSGNGNIR